MLLEQAATEGGSNKQSGMDASAAAAANVLLTHQTSFGPSFGLEGNFSFVPSVSFQDALDAC